MKEASTVPHVKRIRLILMAQDTCSLSLQNLLILRYVQTNILVKHGIFKIYNRMSRAVCKTEKDHLAFKPSKLF